MPITDETALVNVSLRRIGQQPIAALTENNENARTANSIYESVRDTILGGHPWNCATKRAQLAASSTAPTFDYTYAYPVPADFLRLIRTEWPEDLWRIELIEPSPGVQQKCFVTHTSPFKIIYVARITNVVLMPPTLQDAIVTELASQFAARLIGSESKLSGMKTLADRALAEARFQDSQQSPPLDSLEPYAFLSARRMWGRSPDNSRVWS